MARRLRPITIKQHAELLDALEDLRAARGRLRFAGANKAAAYVARALKSAESAAWHAERRPEYRGPEEWRAADDPVYVAAVQPRE